MKLAIGVQLNSSPKPRHVHCEEVLLRLKSKYPSNIDLYNITFTEDSNMNSKFNHISCLNRSSQTILDISEKKLPISKDLFSALSEQNCDYFIYLNNDILLSEKAVKLVLSREFETICFSRHDIEPLHSINDPIKVLRMEIAGFDAWACSINWWKTHKDLFKDYFVGQWLWDVDYAITMFSNSNGLMCNKDFFIAHEFHERAWSTTSKEAEYNRQLWITHKLHKNWEEYIYSNLIHRLPAGRFLYPIKEEESIANRLLKHL
jgi:hypothetical protein